MWCFNPLWKKEQEELLRELVKHKFQIVISGIFAYPLTEQWLGKPITEDTISELLELRDKYQINPSGEGGEIETTVLDGPDFKKKIKVVEFEKVSEEENTGNFIIKDAELIDK